MAAVKAKVADYFARTQLAAFDGAAVAGLNLSNDDFRKLAPGELAADSPALAALPLARIEANRPLPLLEGVNPAWAGALQKLHKEAVTPVLGASKTSLTPADWALLCDKVNPYGAWIAAKPAVPAGKLSTGRVAAILSGTSKAAIDALFAEDKELAPKVAALADVERLALLYRDLGTLLRNFVNFSDFYSKSRPAVFQVGTLYIDGRSCRLCIRVDDIGSHSAFALMSRSYVAYVECRRQGETMKVAAAITQGDSDYLFVGRNGVFYDRRGRDWDATVVKIVESPISIRQAFWAPYKRVATLVGDMFAKFAASKDKVVNTSVDKAVNATAERIATAVQPAPPPQPPFDIAKFAGIFAAVGLAFAGIGSAITAVVVYVDNTPIWKKPLLVLAVILLISGPSMLIAFLRLRQRTLGPLLEGTGWAINGRVKINVPLGTALTDRGVLPTDSKRLAFDPYADNAARNRSYALLAVVLCVAAWLIAAKVTGRWPF